MRGCAPDLSIWGKVKWEGRPERSGDPFSVLAVHPAAQGLDLAAHLLGLEAAFLGPQRGARRDAAFGFDQGLPDQFCQAVAHDVAVAGLAAVLVAVQDERALLGPAAAREPFEPGLDRAGQVGGALGLEAQLDRARHLVDVLPAGAGGADELLGQFPILYGDLVGDPQHAAVPLMTW